MKFSHKLVKVLIFIPLLVLYFCYPLIIVQSKATEVQDILVNNDQTSPSQLNDKRDESTPLLAPDENKNTSLRAVAPNFSGGISVSSLINEENSANLDNMYFGPESEKSAFRTYEKPNSDKSIQHFMKAMDELIFPESASRKAAALKVSVGLTGVLASPPFTGFIMESVGDTLYIPLQGDLSKLMITWTMLSSFPPFINLLYKRTGILLNMASAFKSSNSKEDKEAWVPQNYDMSRPLRFSISLFSGMAAGTRAFFYTGLMALAEEAFPDVRYGMGPHFWFVHCERYYKVTLRNTYRLYLNNFTDESVRIKLQRRYLIQQINNFQLAIADSDELVEILFDKIKEEMNRQAEPKPEIASLSEIVAETEPKAEIKKDTPLSQQLPSIDHNFCTSALFLKNPFGLVKPIVEKNTAGELPVTKAKCDEPKKQGDLPENSQTPETEALKQKIAQLTSQMEEQKQRWEAEINKIKQKNDNDNALDLLLERRSNYLRDSLATILTIGIIGAGTFGNIIGEQYLFNSFLSYVFEPSAASGLSWGFAAYATFYGFIEYYSHKAFLESLLKAHSWQHLVHWKALRKIIGTNSTLVGSMYGLGRVLSIFNSLDRWGAPLSIKIAASIAPFILETSFSSLGVSEETEAFTTEWASASLPERKPLFDTQCNEAGNGCAYNFWTLSQKRAFLLEKSNEVKENLIHYWNAATIERLFYLIGTPT